MGFVNRLSWQPDVNPAIIQKVLKRTHHIRVVDAAETIELLESKEECEYPDMLLAGYQMPEMMVEESTEAMGRMRNALQDMDKRMRGFSLEWERLNDSPQVPIL